MRRIIGKLTALEFERLKRKRKPGLVSDGGQLYFKDGQSGIFRYLGDDGKTHDHGLGPLFDLSLVEVRELAAAARKLRLEGKDPIRSKRETRAKIITFDEAAKALFTALRPGWRSARHAAEWQRSIANLSVAFLDMDVAAVDTAAVMRELDPIWPIAPEAASRLRGRIESILDWSKVRGHRDGENPARWRGHLDHLLPPRLRVRPVEHHAALPYDEIGAFMADLRGRKGVAAMALEFAILTATRSGEVLGATWREVDRKLWTIPAGRMKAATEHRVPLSDRALEILAEMSAIRGGPDDCVFPSPRGRPFHRHAMLKVLQRMGCTDLSVHGFRSTFRDWAGNETHFPREVCEQALGHVIGEQAYRRSDALEKRRRLMDAWSSYCDRPSGEHGKVVPFAAR